jgi:hypothetical protein
MFPGGKGGRCLGLTTLPPSCADCLKIWEPQPPGTLRACNGIALLTKCTRFKFIYLFSSALHVSGFLLAHLQRQVYNFGSGSSLLSTVSAPGRWYHKQET